MTMIPLLFLGKVTTLNRWLLFFHLHILLWVTSWQAKRRCSVRTCGTLPNSLICGSSIHSHQTVFYVFLIAKYRILHFILITSVHHKPTIRMPVKGTIIYFSNANKVVSPLNAKSAIFILFLHSKQIYLMWSPRWCFFSPLEFQSWKWVMTVTRKSWG